MPESGFGVSLSNQFAALEDDAPSTEVKSKDGKSDAAAVRKKVDKKDKTKAKAATRSGKPAEAAKAPNPKKKEHDRHSGVTKSTKKAGAGAHGWGKETENFEEDYAAQQQQQQQQQQEEETTTGPVSAESAKPGDEKESLTYNEFRKKQEIGRAVQQECRDRSRMPSSA
eukprot:TRINITY_DN355_c1_g1_i2.p1 TRINITY_DN355_c1_g1~~TRINITY_DN355_c1_g1_i2.p1  ORF type:complete len:169 (-),score=43.36 TRINITY_DN355_c1_g1_i2:19-525(-)